MPKSQLSALVAAKLESSGLTVQDGKQLGVRALTAKQADRLLPKHKPGVPCLQLVYHDARGRPRPDVYRVRLLKPTKGQFGEARDLRYLQPPGSPPAAYLPTTVPWARVVKDPSIDVLLTEGELKAACAAKLGYACVGLGGVSSWRSKKHRLPLLPELEAVEWRGRDVYIAFDSDAATNAQVAAEIGRLSRALADRGAQPRVVSLPAVPGLPKTGLDDLVVHLGSAALDQALEQAAADELTQKLWEFNARFCFVLDPGLVYDFELDALYDAARFKNSLFSNVWAQEVTGATEQGLTTRRVQVAPRWVTWPQRRQLAGLTYRPGHEQVLPAKHGHERLNTWPGWAVEPAKGDVRPWKALLDHLFQGAEPAARRWFEQWCLYPLAHPGAKLLTACGLWSLEQGLGKSLIGKTLGRIYGSNYSEISQQDLESPFNGWAVRKQLVMVDDVSAYDSRAKADVLKKLITQDQLQVNVKFQPTYQLPDCVNLYLTSNRANAFFLEDQDRRYFIHEITSPKASDAFWDRYYAWLAGAGPAALLHHAQHAMSFEGFLPHKPPPLTAAKQAMVAAADTELDQWLKELREDPEGKLTHGRFALQRDLLTAGELLQLFNQARQGRPVSVNMVGARAGELLPRLLGGRTIKPNGKSERFYIVRNVAKWRRATVHQAAKHITQGRQAEAGAQRSKY